MTGRPVGVKFLVGHPGFLDTRFADCVANPEGCKALRVARYAERTREQVEIIAHACGLHNAAGFRPEHVTAIERGVSRFRSAGP